MSSTSRPILLTAIICLVLGWMLNALAPRLLGSFVSSRAPIPEQWQHELRILGEKAIGTRDVPVAALVLYADSIIGRGWNTVAANGDAGGHAEINAVSDAIHRMGISAFRSLDRDSLELVSTFEPCLMCEGALLEYNVRRTDYLLDKSTLHWLREDLRLARQRSIMRQRGPDSLQWDLFRESGIGANESSR